MNEILKRITSESPTFFKKIQAIGITIGVIGVAILATPVTLATFGIVYVLPATISTIASHMAAAGTVAAAVAKTTVADPSVLEKKDEPVKQQSENK